MYILVLLKWQGLGITAPVVLSVKRSEKVYMCVRGNLTAVLDQGVVGSFLLVILISCCLVPVHSGVHVGLVFLYHKIMLVKII